MLDLSVNEVREFWLEKISEDFSATSLIPDHNLPADKAGAETINIRIPAECQQPVSEKTGDSPFLIYTILMAALNICLYKYTKSEKIVVGSPARIHDEIEENISNALPIINTVNPAQTVKDFLKAVRASLIEAYKNQHFDYENMISERKLEQQPDKFQLFDISLAFTGIHGVLPNVNNNINLVFSKSADRLEGEITFRTKFYKTETIEYFAKHLVAGLTDALNDLEKPVGLVEILPAPERERLLSDWSGKNDLDELPQLTAVELFERQVDASPDAVAAVCDDRHITYAELDAAANRLAHFLESKNISLEQRVGIMLERGIEMVSAVLATLKCGAVYVPLDAGYPPERLAFMIEDAAPDVIITDTGLEARLPWTAAEIVRLDEARGAIEAFSGERTARNIRAENGAYMIYTSGSTGKPKGVLVTHGGLEALSREQSRSFGIGAESRVLQFASLSFDASVSEIIMTLASGGVLCLAKQENLRSGLDVGRIIGRLRIDVATLPPALLAVISPDESWNLKTIIAAGEACNPKIVEKWSKNRRFLNAYGPTETTVCATIWKFEGEEMGENVPIGKPIRNTEVYVLDEAMNPVAVGVAGELYLGGKGVARGYWNQAALTAASFVPHPFGRNGARLYKTGDLGRFLADGQIEYLGRADRQIKIRGYRVEPGEIEGQIKLFSGVEDAVVEVVTDAGGDKQLICYYVGRKNGTELSPDTIRRHLKKRLPEYMIPARFMELENIPLTSNGKVDRVRLAEFSVENEKTKNIEKSELPNPAVELLIGIWEEILGIQVTGTSDNFFELGGHSLLATQLISRLRDAFGIELELGVIFDNPQLDALADHLLEKIAGGNGEQLPRLEAVAKDQPLPLSFAQQRMWFLNQFEGASGNYNISSPLRIKGEINLQALEKSLETIISRHEILRTSFGVAADGSLFQKIEPPRDFKLNIVDLTSQKIKEAEKEARRLANEAARFKFDLTSGRLFNLNLIKLSDAESVLSVTMHHIISDGWSTAVFVRELAAAYRAFLDHALPDLPSLPFQYADYAVWQRSSQAARRFDSQLRFWKEQLGTPSAPLALPTDFPRPAVRTFGGAKQFGALAGDLVRRLKQLSRAENATLFMTLLAAFQLWLSRVCGQTEINVGTPTANRQLRELEDLIGFFVNTLVIRGRLNPGDSFLEHLKRVRAATLSAFAHQEIPFEKLVEELRPERELSRTPLFDVMFVMQNAPTEKLELEGLELSGFGMQQETAKFDLTLTVDEAEEEQLVIGIEYNTDLFQAESIKRYLQSFEELLTNIVAEPEREIRHLNILPAPERERLLSDWSGKNDLDELPQLTAVELFERQVDASPDAVAAVADDRQITYAELDAAANRLAHFLESKNISLEQRVGIMLERGIEMVSAVLATLKCGGVYVPLDAGYPPERLAFMIEDAAPDVIITDTGLEARLPWTAAEIVRLDEARDAIETLSAERTARNIRPENGAYMIYTSGSTGKPKGVLVTHGGLEGLSKEQSRSFGIGAESRVLQFASLSFDASVFDFSMALFNGGTLYLADRETILPSRKMVDYLAENKISIITVTPTALSALPFAGLPDLKTINVAGEACSLELAGRWAENRRFFNLYGPTEATIWATTFEFDKNAERISIGRPVKNTEVYLLDEAMNPVAVGVAGELYLGGKGVARGYWNQAALTAASFVPHPFGRDGARLYKTGDLGRFLADGQIEYLGRADRQIKIRGYRVELGEIETVLGSFENVREAVVNPNADDKDNIWLTAYIVSSEGAAFNAAEIREQMQKLLPNYMIPARFVGLESLPLLPNGKLDRKNLPDADADVETETRYQPPSTIAEAKIAEIWCEVLNLKKVGIEDNFFTLGGHSLLLAQVHARLSQISEKEISLLDLFKYPTIKALAAFIAEESIAETDSGKARERAETRLELRNKQAALRKRARETQSGK